MTEERKPQRVQVTLMIDPGLWAQVQARVPNVKQMGPGEHERALAKEIRCALQAYVGPDPESVIHDVKRREREGLPKRTPPDYDAIAKAKKDAKNTERGA